MNQKSNCTMRIERSHKRDCLIFHPDDLMALELWVSGQRISVNEIDIHIDHEGAQVSLKVPMTLKGELALPAGKFELLQCCPICTAELDGAVVKEET